MNTHNLEGLPQQPTIELTHEQLELAEQFKQQLEQLNDPEFSIARMLSAEALAAGCEIDRMGIAYESGILSEDNARVVSRQTAFRQAAMLGMTLGNWLFPDVHMTVGLVHNTTEAILGYTKNTKVAVEESTMDTRFRETVIAETIKTDFTTSQEIVDCSHAIPTEGFGDDTMAAYLNAGFQFGMYIYERAELARREMQPIGDDWTAGLAELDE